MHNTSFSKICYLAIQIPILWCGYRVVISLFHLWSLFHDLHLLAKLSSDLSGPHNASLIKVYYCQEYTLKSHCLRLVDLVVLTILQ